MSNWICEEDSEDFEQEKLIKEWLKASGKSLDFEYQYTNSKGNARNSFGQTVSLDKKIGHDEECALSDFIAGCDGRDLEFGCGTDEIRAGDSGVRITGYLLAMGFEKGELECLTKILKSSTLESNSRSEKLATNLEW